MEQLHTDSTNTDSSYHPGEEPLSDYVKRMETDANLKKLAQMLEDDLKKPVSKDKPDHSTPDLSFEKFEEKLRRRDD